MGNTKFTAEGFELGVQNGSCTIDMLEPLGQVVNQNQTLY